MDKIGFIKKDMYNLECSVNGKLRNHDVELVTECCCIRYHIQHESIRLDICTNVGSEVEVAEGWTSNNKVGGSSSQTQYMKDPKRVRCKGRSKGVMEAKEKAMKRGIRHCRECGQIGHDRTQCPALNTP
ncbi:hypothetical protein L3X38_004065 [Prunus dulcis]|uniref:CCHC-type domain-containing protein n=1 Tax=Prunus dulcis TaxID=3755 RepID=A0AAD4ZNA1_PRUDU|nr:hypothetical protein L3X38_004065 [Prunus dulcis]